MLNKSNVEQELFELKNNSFIIDFKLESKKFIITTLENNEITFNTDYSSYYEFSCDSLSLFNENKGKTYESFESILSVFSKKYSEKFNEVLMAKLQKLSENNEEESFDNTNQTDS